MCCLAYENETYRRFKKELPRVGSTIRLGEIDAKVIELNILKKKVLVSYRDEEATNGKRLEWVDFSHEPVPSPYQETKVTENV